jgi:hypothetical protein
MASMPQRNEENFIIRSSVTCILHPTFSNDQTKEVEMFWVYGTYG